MVTGQIRSRRYNDHSQVSRFGRAVLFTHLSTRDIMNPTWPKQPTSGTQSNLDVIPKSIKQAYVDGVAAGYDPNALSGAAMRVGSIFPIDLITPIHHDDPMLINGGYVLRRLEEIAESDHAKFQAHPHLALERAGGIPKAYA